ncbi:OmpA family protein [Frigidibacter sp. MR17.14]|uniref:OmpA family protein n=1 Tax=Frigidibacter sp. MR17.14 TaxID=3126509 RepID=UPI003012B83A
MKPSITPIMFAGLLVVSASLTAGAQQAPLPATPAPAEAQEVEPLSIYFGTGSSSISTEGTLVLDEAARLFRAGDPIVMIVAGGADTIGDPRSNLELSIRRAQKVADGLVARGIPVERLQVLGRGQSDLAVTTDTNVDNAQNRVVEISWR